jgi:hypothetical protein
MKKLKEEATELNAAYRDEKNSLHGVEREDIQLMEKIKYLQEK